MKLFQRHLSRTLLYTTLGIGGILTAIIWLMQSLRFARAVMHQGVSLHGFLELCLGSLPRTILVIAPVAFLLATLWCYNRIIHDNERDAISACGVWPWFFAWPCVRLSLFMVILLYGFSFYLSPLTVRLSKNREYHIHHYLDPSFITPGVFFQVEDKTFYVHRQKNKTLFEGIFIYDDKGPHQKTMVTGKYARVIPKKGGFEIHLQQGTRQQVIDKKSPTMLSFEEYTFRFGPQAKEDRKRHIHEMSFSELMNPPDGKKGTYEKELRQRLFLPLLPLMDGLLVTLILLYASGFFWPSVAAIVLVCGSHLLVFYQLTLCIWLILLALLGWAFMLFLKR